MTYKPPFQFGLWWPYLATLLVLVGLAIFVVCIEQTHSSGIRDVALPPRKPQIQFGLASLFVLTAGVAVLATAGARRFIRKPPD